MSITKEQVAAAIRVTAAVAEAIRELGEVPEGELVSRSGNLVRWIEPAK